MDTNLYLDSVIIIVNISLHITENAVNRQTDMENRDHTTDHSYDLIQSSLRRTSTSWGEWLQWERPLPCR